MRRYNHICVGAVFCFVLFAKWLNEIFCSRTAALPILIPIPIPFHSCWRHPLEWLWGTADAHRAIQIQIQIQIEIGTEIQIQIHMCTLLQAHIWPSSSDASAFAGHPRAKCFRYVSRISVLSSRLSKILSLKSLPPKKVKWQRGMRLQIRYSQYGQIHWGNIQQS